MAYDCYCATLSFRLPVKIRFYTTLKTFTQFVHERKRRITRHCSSGSIFFYRPLMQAIFPLIENLSNFFFKE